MYKILRYHSSLHQNLNYIILHYYAPQKRYMLLTLRMNVLCYNNGNAMEFLCIEIFETNKVLLIFPMRAVPKFIKKIFYFSPLSEICIKQKLLSMYRKLRKKCTFLMRQIKTCDFRLYMSFTSYSYM